MADLLKVLDKLINQVTILRTDYKQWILAKGNAPKVVHLVFAAVCALTQKTTVMENTIFSYLYNA